MKFSEDIRTDFPSQCVSLEKVNIKIKLKIWVSEKPLFMFSLNICNFKSVLTSHPLYLFINYRYTFTSSLLTYWSWRNHYEKSKLVTDLGCSQILSPYFEYMNPCSLHLLYPQRHTCKFRYWDFMCHYNKED